MSTLRKDFDKIIETLNQSHTTSIPTILSRMKEKHEDITKYQVEQLFAKRRYRKIKNSDAPNSTKNIYINPLFVFNFLLEDRKVISDDFTLSQNIKDKILEDNHKLLLAFSIKFIRIYEIPLTCNISQNTSFTLYRVQVKLHPTSQDFLQDIWNLIEDLNEDTDKIETLDTYGSYIILTTMSKKFAKYIRKTLLEPYTRIWKESKSFTSTSINFNLSYKHEPTNSDYMTIKERFLLYLEEQYPPLEK